MKIIVFAIVAILALTVSGKTYFSENFNDDGWTSRWTESTFKGSDAGEWVHTSGKFSPDESDKGIKTGTDFRFYQISAPFEKFSNKDETLVFQFSLQNGQHLDCGGGYIKLLPEGIDHENFNGDSPYNIMFGPDICGSTRRVHVIFSYKGQNYLIKETISCETDVYTHVYTLIVNADQTFKVLVDNVEKKSGSLLELWDFLPAKTINDPEQSKPVDWVESANIADPEAVKPEGWDDIPELIIDPEAEKPEDWDAELDGDWEAPLIANPDYEGEWEAPQIPNPAYKGPWVHPQVPNPAYIIDNEIYAYTHAGVGIEIWQVKSGSVFDNILVTNDVEEASAAAQKIVQLKDSEKKVQIEQEAEVAGTEDAELARLEAELDEEEEEEVAHNHAAHEEL